MARDPAVEAIRRPRERLGEERDGSARRQEPGERRGGGTPEVRRPSGVTRCHEASRSSSLRSARSRSLPRSGSGPAGAARPDPSGAAGRATTGRSRSPRRRARRIAPSTLSVRPWRGREGSARYDGGDVPGPLRSEPVRHELLAARSRRGRRRRRRGPRFRAGRGPRAPRPRTAGAPPPSCSPTHTSTTPTRPGISRATTFPSTSTRTTRSRSTTSRRGTRASRTRSRP